MSITRRSLIAGAVAVPAAAALPAPADPIPEAQAWGDKITITDPLDRYRFKSWKVMWNGYDPDRFLDLYRIVDENADD